MRDKIISAWKDSITIDYGFEIKEFDKFHWRLFRGGGEIYFLFVCGIDEVALFIADDNKKFIPMRDSTINDELFVICQGDEDFEACKKIILQKDNWKKDVILLHKNKRRLVRALCNASVLDPQTFKEIKCHQCIDSTKPASILSILTKKES